MEDLYTFVLDYKGGTHISQVTAMSPDDALSCWLKSLDFQGIGVKNDTLEDVISDIEYIEDTPVPLEGMRNVWCITLSFDDKFALVNFVKTESDE